MANDSPARLDEHRRLLADELDRLEATEPGTDECRAAIKVVDARLNAMDQLRDEHREQRITRQTANLRPVNQALGGATAALALVAAVLSSTWLLIFLVPAVAVGVLLVLRPSHRARRQTTLGVVAFVISLLCLVFGGV